MRHWEDYNPYLVMAASSLAFFRQKAQGGHALVQCNFWARVLQIHLELQHPIWTQVYRGIHRVHVQSLLTPTTQVVSAGS